MDNSPQIPEERKRRIQRILGTFLYYACAVECTMLPALDIISGQQANPTHNTEASITHFLYYVATNPTTIVQYKAIDMVLHIDSHAAYLSKPQAHSPTGGHYYLRFLTANPKKSQNLPPPANVPIHT